MRRLPDKILPDGVLSRLIPILTNHGVVAAYIFGSRIDNTHHDASDYDIAVYLDDENYPTYLWFQLREDIRPLFEPHELDVVLLDRAGIELRFEIISTGVVILGQNGEKTSDFEDRVIRDYLDFEPFLRKFREEVFEAVLEEG